MNRPTRYNVLVGDSLIIPDPDGRGLLRLRIYDCNARLIYAIDSKFKPPAGPYDFTSNRRFRTAAGPHNHASNRRFRTSAVPCEFASNKGFRTATIPYQEAIVRRRRGGEYLIGKEAEERLFGVEEVESEGLRDRLLGRRGWGGIKILT